MLLQRSIGQSRRPLSLPLPLLLILWLLLGILCLTSVSTKDSSSSLSHILLVEAAAAEDPYHVLGVSRSASVKRIKKAYRKLAKKHHPDVSQEDDAREKFERVQRAYDLLSDSEKKAFYDRHGFAPDDKQGDQGHPFQPEWHGFTFGFGGPRFSHRRRPQAQPIQSISQSLSMADALRVLNYRGDQLTILQLYHDDCYECRVFSSVWESLVKSPMKHYVNFFRLNVLAHEDIFQQFETNYGGNAGAPRLIAFADGKQWPVKIPDEAFDHSAGGQPKAVNAITEWINSFLTDVLNSVTRIDEGPIRYHQKSSTNAPPSTTSSNNKLKHWLETLTERHVGLVLYPSSPNDGTLLYALQSRISQRTRRVATLASRATLVDFLQHDCPAAARKKFLGQLQSAKEFLLVFNGTGICDFVAITATTTTMRTERVLPLIGHRVIPPLVPGVCGRGKHEHSMCFIRIHRTNRKIQQPTGSSSSVPSVETWSATLRSVVDQFHLVQVDAQDEPDFVKQLDLTEVRSKKSPGGAATGEGRPSDLVFIVYIATDPSRYGTIRVRSDENLLERIRSKVPGALAKMLHGQRLRQVAREDIMDALVQPQFTLSWWRYYLSQFDLSLTFPGWFTIFMLWALYKLISGATPQQQGSGGNGNRGAQQQRARSPPNRASRPATSGGGGTGSSSTARAQTPPHTAHPQPPNFFGTCFLAREDVENLADGFLILAFVPRHFVEQKIRVPTLDTIPMSLRISPKTRLRVVHFKHRKWWKWFEDTSKVANFHTPTNDASFVAIRIKKRKAGFKPVERSFDRWIEELLDGSLALPFSAPISGSMTDGGSSSSPSNPSSPASQVD